MGIEIGGRTGGKGMWGGVKGGGGCRTPGNL
jgi:hypothetical protein